MSQPNHERQSTLDYYNQNADAYIQKTEGAKVSTFLQGFVGQLPWGASVLDVGCGSGRDSRAMLNQGLNVTAMDASVELARRASDYIQRHVSVVPVEEMTWSDEFEGIWAMASLLHLPKAQMGIALFNCVRALKINGTGLFYAVFKQGSGEALDEQGRYFSYYQPAELKQLFLVTGYFDSVDVGVDEDVLGRTGLQWISVQAKKKAGLSLLVPDPKAAELKVEPWDLKTVYNVHAYRFGNRDDHSYLVGVFTSKEKALAAAEAEFDYRGHKYYCEVLETTLNEGGGQCESELKVILGLGPRDWGLYQKLENIRYNESYLFHPPRCYNASEYEPEMGAVLWLHYDDWGKPPVVRMGSEIEPGFTHFLIMDWQPVLNFVTGAETPDAEI